jgi:Arc/MetJ-type ribon-helix-helix transcriptional regulator
VTVSIDEALLGQLDQLVQQATFENRSAGMEAAIASLLAAQVEAEYVHALAQLTPEDVAENQALADEGLADYARGLEGYPW